ncbi:MAG: putative alkaline phosphatase, partial [Frankiales bacterium]|nr:putative alkaline phosphatase [Frankiales bacterium]
MTPPLDRRTLLKAGAAAGGLVAVGARPASAQAAPAQAATSVFRHGVASGDPLGTAVVLWTRVTPSRDAAPGSGRGASTTVVWELADDPAFRAVRRTGTVRTAATSDHTVKVDVTGLSPYTRYWYRFRALGVTSPVGRTQTAADDGRLHALRLAFVSCANWTGGYFTGYRYVARRDDLDLVLHLGDYLYEYGNAEDRYGPATLVGEREHDPATEMVSLSDYRRRHAQYKTDPDLQAAHAAHPWIVVLDDHEVANDTYDTGAENHTEGAEGAFGTRRTRAYQAYVEWMPIRLPDQTGAVGVRFWRRFSFGPLADLSVIDTRQNRSIPLDGVQGALVGTDLAGLTDPSRVLMEPAQMAWLTDGLRDDAVRWHLIGNQTVFTRVALGRSTPQALAPLGLGSAAFNTDQWDGYQDDQRQVLQAMAAAGGDPVVLTGDIHSSWANDCPLDPSAYVPVGPLNDSVGVEFVCPSITSDGFTEILGGDEAALAATTGLQVTNPHVRYLDGIGHGFAVLDVTPERVQSDFWFVSSREDQDATLRYASGWQSTRGSRQVVAARGPVGARSDRPRTAVVT